MMMDSTRCTVDNEEDEISDNETRESKKKRENANSSQPKKKGTDRNVEVQLFSFMSTPEHD